MANNNWSQGQVTDGSVSGLSDTQIAAFPTFLDQYASQTLKTASSFMRLWLLFAEKVERTNVNKNVKAGRSQKNMSSLIVSGNNTTARGQDNKFQWNRRYQYQFALGITNATISGTPGATSTYTLTDATAYDSTGKLSNVYLDYSYKLPNAATSGVPYVIGYITSIDTTTDFAHVLTIKPERASDTLPSVTANDAMIFQGLVTRTGGDPSYVSDFRSYATDFNYFQTMVPGTKYTNDTPEYMSRFAVDTDLYKGILNDIYKEGIPASLNPDGQRSISQSIIDYAIRIVASMNVALLWGQKNHTSVTTANGIERRDSMGGLMEACLTGGGIMGYNFALPTQDMFYEMAREFEVNGVSYYNYMMLPGIDLKQKIQNDMAYLPNNLGFRTALNLDKNMFMYAGENNDAALNFIEERGFQNYSWMNYNFMLFANFTDFDNAQQFGSQGYPDMSKNAFLLPAELMNTTSTTGAASSPMQVLFASNGGGLTEEFTLVDAIRTGAVKYMRNVAISRDYQTTHSLVDSYSTETVMTAAFLGKEAMYMMQPE